MKVLFDQGTPVPLRRYLDVSSVETTFELGWQTLTNGDLLTRAEEHGFDVLVTTDQNLRYQQNLENRTIAIVVLRSTSWPRIHGSTDRIAQVVLNAKNGDYIEVEIPEL
jgi:hypothetical protein